MKTRKLLLTALSMMFVATSAIAFASCDKIGALKGETGDKGDTGAVGLPGQDGADGKTITGVEYDENGDLVFTFSDGTTQTVADPNKHTHAYGEWTKLTGNNCEDGVFSRTCECGEIEWKQGIGHVWGLPTIVDATCTVKGSSTRVCTRCEEADVEVLYQDHTFAEDDTAKETCTTCNYVVKGSTGLLFEEKEDGTYAVTGYNGTEMKVVIPAVYKNALVTEIVTNAFYGKAADGTLTTSAASMTSVTIPTSVTKIGNAAFAYSGLKKITIPDSVTDLGNSTFVGCPNLKSVTFGSGLTALGDKIFQASAIESVVLPDNITTLGTRAFYNCASLKTVKLGNAMTVMGQEAFRGCTALESINLENITEYLKQSLQNTTALKSVVVSANLTSLKNNVFASGALETVYYLGTAEKFATVTIGSSGNDNFKNAIHYYSETEPTTEGKFWHYVDDVPTVWTAGTTEPDTPAEPETPVEPEQPEQPEQPETPTPEATVEINGLTLEYSADSKGYVVKSYAGTATEVVIPADYKGTPVVEIYGVKNAGAFYGNTTITSVQLPVGIKTIGDYAFESCTALTTINLPAGLEVIGGRSLRNTAITSLTIPSTVKEIGNYAFFGCDELVSFIMEEGEVVTWGKQVFDGNDTHGYCSKLTTVKLRSNTTEIVDRMFQNCTGLETIVIPNAVTAISAGFTKCSSLKTIIMGGKVASITKNSFSGTALTAVYYTCAQSEVVACDVNATGNDLFTGATKYYYSETAPTTEGNFWHYVEGVVTAWPAYEAPGSSEEAPGTSEETPGTSEEAPGSSEERPGSSEETPGTSEEAPNANGTLG